MITRNASTANDGVTNSATAQIIRVLRESHRLRPSEENDFVVHSQAEFISMLSSTSALLTILLTFVAGISLVIGGIGIMNIMYVSVTERTREIGLRMSIRASGKDILLQFLIEAILLSVTGGIIGVLSGFFSTWMVTLLLKWPTVVSQSSVILSFVVCALTSIFFGYYPAQKASLLDPHRGLAL